MNSVTGAGINSPGATRARIAQDAELQRETETVVGTPALPDVPRSSSFEYGASTNHHLDRPASGAALRAGDRSSYATRHICSLFLRRKGLIQLIAMLV